MAITVINAVIHGFDKEQRSDVLTNIFRRPTPLDVSKKPVIALVDGVAGLLGGSDNSLAWGRFRTDSRRGLFPDSFKKAVETPPDLSDPRVFHALTLVAFEEILKLAKDSNFATGSKILFAFYEDGTGDRHLLIALIKQKGGIQLTQDYEPIDTETLDMQKLSHAAEIKCTEYLDITAYEASHFASEGDAEEEFEYQPYLSFMSKRDADGAADYFIDALGCELHRSSKKSTEVVIKAAHEICKNNKELRPYANLAKEAVRAYLKEQLEKNLPATLEEIKEVIKRQVPIEHGHYFDDFVETMNGGKYKVPAEFNVSGETLEKLSRFTLKDNGVEIKFDKEDFGTGENSKIKFNKEEKSIRIKLTDKQIAALEKLLKENV